KGKVKLRIGQENSVWVIDVLDNGVGIDNEELEDIFESFYQSKDADSGQGWGIGLALVKEIVSLHHGTIDVASRSEEVEPGYTTKFTVRLPYGEDMVSKAVEADTPVPEEEEISLVDWKVQSFTSSYKILVVEDNIELREFLCAHLKESYQVVQAEDGAQGLQMAIEKIPDIIITDIAMPNMDGFELVRALKANQDTSHIPVVMLTARGESSDMLEGYRYGALYYITKPFVLEMLEIQLHNIMATIEQLKAVNRKYVFQDVPFE